MAIIPTCAESKSARHQAHYSRCLRTSTELAYVDALVRIVGRRAATIMLRGRKETPASRVYEYASKSFPGYVFGKAPTKTPAKADA